MPESWIPIAESVLEPHFLSFRAALEAGVLCGTGTDGFGEMVEEMELFVKAGRTPYQAIQAATRDGARIMGLERRLGCLTPGFQADLIAVPGNPHDDLAVQRRPRLVMWDGVVRHTAGHPA